MFFSAWLEGPIDDFPVLRKEGMEEKEKKNNHRIQM